MNKRKQKKLYLKLIFTSLLGAGIIVNNLSFASNFQNFAGINYTNPADLSALIKDKTFILGYDYVIPKLNYRGTITVPDPFGLQNVVSAGSASIQNKYDLPYGRIAKRLNKQWVIDLDITSPYKSIVQYSPTSPARYATTNTAVQSIDYAPSVAYQFSGKLEKLSIGAGLDIMQVWAALDQKYPSLTIPFGAGPDITITNHASAWTYGWHLGLAYQLMQATFLGLSYFSDTTLNLTGISTFTGFPSSNKLSAKLNLPAMTTFEVTQFLKETWWARLQLRYTQWSRLSRANLKNTAGPSSTGLVILNYSDTWEADLTSQYYFNEQYYLTGFFSYDQTPTNTANRTLGLPEVSFYTLAIAPGVKINKSFSAELHYAHSWYVRRAPLNNVNPNDGTRTVGGAHLGADIIGMQISLET